MSDVAGWSHTPWTANLGIFDRWRVCFATTRRQFDATNVHSETRPSCHPQVAHSLSLYLERAVEVGQVVGLGCSRDNGLLACCGYDNSVVIGCPTQQQRNRITSHTQRLVVFGASDVSE